eukprot:Blabericola_migrator_1__9386@NODE_506_length_7963_cov_38_720618_g388_i0_p2_GENE_NODE_506_length_7963_cov_38_720618_g388_i0NODE_506_length_7963_cov_38_720618_g388_i0_p2_ORF_typecomplete_len417_score55_90SET/PF00856_28/6_1e11_NODE_506_length_7963_cov_38_720618_g388_i028734123
MTNIEDLESHGVLSFFLSVMLELPGGSLYQPQRIGRVGRSLVAAKQLSVGEEVLCESSIVSYELLPTCRSSKCPRYTKRLWTMLCRVVNEEVEVTTEFLTPHVSFVPGLPAIMMEYLNNEVTRKLIPSIESFFYCPARDPTLTSHPLVKVLRLVAARVFQEIQDFRDLDGANVEELIVLMSVMYGNAHCLSVGAKTERCTHTKKKRRRLKYALKHPDDGAYAITAWPSQRHLLEPTARVALFPWTSRFAHSCKPNAFLTYRDDTLRLIISRPVAVGELVTFTYLSNIEVLGPYQQRQAHLFDYKFFLCRCVKCEAGDQTNFAELLRSNVALASLRTSPLPPHMKQQALRTALTRYMTLVMCMLWPEYKPLALLRLIDIKDLAVALCHEEWATTMAAISTYTKIFARCLPDMREVLL